MPMVIPSEYLPLELHNIILENRTSTILLRLKKLDLHHSADSMNMHAQYQDS
jgi:hypothetical protein